MNDEIKKHPGQISWADLIIEDAREIRDFYTAVVGWKHDAVPMGEYNDFTMAPKNGGEPVAGICHARGPNQGLPPQWLIYITVADLDHSVEQCEQLGGKLLFGPLELNNKSRYAVITDPAGAHVALYQED